MDQPIFLLLLAGGGLTVGVLVLLLLARQAAYGDRAVRERTRQAIEEYRRQAIAEHRAAVARMVDQAHGRTRPGVTA